MMKAISTAGLALFLGLGVGVLAGLWLAALTGGGLIAAIALVELGILTAIFILGAIFAVRFLRLSGDVGTAYFQSGAAITISQWIDSRPAQNPKRPTQSQPKLAFGRFPLARFLMSNELRLPIRTEWSRSEMALVAGVAIALAAFGQFRLGSPGSNGLDGVVLYLVAMTLFIGVVKWTEEGGRSSEAVHERVLGRGYSYGRSIRIILVSLALLAMALILTSSDLVRFDRDQSVNTLLWIFANLCLALAFFPWGEKSNLASLHPKLILGKVLSFVSHHSFEMFSLSAILLLAFAVRAFDLATIPRAFGGDEGEMGASAIDALHGRIDNPFITGWFSHPTLFFFLQGLAMRLFGETIFGIRLLSVIAGTLTVATACVLVRQLFDQKVAIMTAALLAFYSAHIHFSRLALNNIEDGLIACTVLALLYSGLTTQRTIWFAGAGASLGFGMYFYQGARIIPIIVALIVAFWFVRDRETIRGSAPNLVIMAFASLVAAGPLFTFFYSQPSAFTARFAEVSILTNGDLARAFNSQGGVLPFLFEQARRSLLAFNSVPESSMFYSIGIPLLDPISGFLFAFGLAYSLYRIRDKSYFIMLTWFLCGVIFGGVLIADPPTSARMQIVFVPVMFFAAQGLAKLVELIAALWPDGRRIAWAASVCLIVFLVILNLKSYFFDYTPKEIYGGDAALAATEMGDYFLGYPRPFKAYVLGDSIGFIHIGTLRFMVPHLDGLSVDDKLLAAPDFVDNSTDALFVAFPSRTEELGSIRRAFPGGTLLDFQKRNGDLLFSLYEVRKS